MTLELTATTSGQLSDMISINNDRINSEVYVGDRLEVKDIKLNFDTESSETVLLQNQPNPFSEITTIGFNLK